MKVGFSDKKCGLLGEKLGHSFSPQIHAMLSDYSYQLFEVSPDKLSDFMADDSLDAFNVTIPYKKAVIPYLDELSREARDIGAVNVVVRRNGKLFGYNTDYFGFKYMIDSANVNVKDKKAILFGNGGAAAPIKTVLSDKGIGKLVIIDKDENTPEFLSAHTDAQIIINATPVGMYPNNRKCVTDLSLFPNCEAVLDIVYNPVRTELLLSAESRGITAVGGLSMLVAQAVRGFELFTDEPSENGITEKILDKLLRDMQNIILIGMPSCGKSTIGKLIASATNRSFFDADEEFLKMHGISPGNAINSLGEAKFREMEQETLAFLGKTSSSVIATGGGAVTRNENYPSLHQNGIIVYIKRDINQLSTEGRPLSKSGSLQALFDTRKPLYEAFADITVKNDSTCELCAKDILNALSKYRYSCAHFSK